jgi:hypothetical protein
VPPMPTASIDERAHRNLADFVRWMRILDPRADLLDAHGVVAVATRTDWPSDRLAVRSTPELAAGEWVDRVDAFLGARGKTACVFARVGEDDDIADDLIARGYVEYARSPEMVCDRALPPRDPADGTALRLAQSPADIAAYAAIAAAAFTDLGILEEPLRSLLDNPAALLQPEVAVALAELDGRPVAGAMSVLLGDEPNGYVGWVSCLRDGRGRQLGDLVTRLVTNEAFARGAAIVTLEASRFGEGTYARMGYKERYRYRMMIKV